MKRLAALLALTLALSGCSGMRLIDNRVSSFAPHSVPSGARYRFERLPSQQTAQQDRLENLAEQSLGKMGLLKSDVGAGLLVNVSTSKRVQSGNPNAGLDVHLGWVLGHGAAGVRQRSVLADLHTQTLYIREVSLIVRDAATQTVLLETHASNDNLWPDDAPILAAMLDAALQGFPKPPTGMRQVDIEIPR